MDADEPFVSASVIVRLGMALGAIVVLALTATVSAIVFAESSTGKAAAINLAGSLRMQSYRIALDALGSGESDAPPDLRHAITEFESRLSSLPRVGDLPADAQDPARRAYEQVASTWSNVLKPEVELSLATSPPAALPFVSLVRAYVLDVDKLVGLLEQDLERRIQTLRTIQGAALFAIIVLIFVVLYLVHARVIVPLGDLLACARRVRHGDFTARAQHVGTDELGQLGRSFNFMVADLSRGYTALEAKVEEETEKLARSNVSLEILYNTTRALAEKAFTHATLDHVVRDLERVIALKAVAVCAREEGDSCGYPIFVATDGADGAGPNPCTLGRCYECFGEGAKDVRAVGSGDERMLVVPLEEGGKSCGALLLRWPPGVVLEQWKIKLLESIGHHIGAALASAKRTDERRRIALMEERSIIARELHDSLAQSLAYLKIQVTRLKALLNDGAGPEQTAEVVAELELGINNGHRQLRELLTTFRLRIDGRGLTEVLRETVAEFSERARIEIQLHDRLLGHELDASEQIHVLQVVREALSNVEHHAHASRANVCLAIEEGGVRVTVDDDGVGIRDAEPPPHHYGLAIMRDRATTLAGTLRISRRTQGGTRVELEFVPRGPYRGVHDPVTTAA